MALPAHVSVKRIPIGGAQFFEGLLRSGRRIVTGGKDDAPVGGGKPLFLCGNAALLAARRLHKLKRRLFLGLSRDCNQSCDKGQVITDIRESTFELRILV
jgi:hypothetical protein